MVWISALGLATLGATGKIELAPAPHLENPVKEADSVCLTPITVPMVFPVAGRCDWSDTFLAPRTGHRHQGQDLMGAKMTPLVACFDGTVRLHRPKTPGGHIYVVLKGDNGWTANYYHVNNDTPGTDDGAGLDEYAFAPGLVDGQHVEAGQQIAFLGDSGNAEDTAPHCHFELWESATKTCVNATPSLESAVKTEDVTRPRQPRRTPSRSHSTATNQAEWEGQILAVDVLKRRLKIAVESTRSPDGKVDLRRRDQWVTVEKTAKVFMSTTTGYEFDLTDLMEGTYARIAVASAGTEEPRATCIEISH